MGGVSFSLCYADVVSADSNDLISNARAGPAMENPIIMKIIPTIVSALSGISGCIGTVIEPLSCWIAKVPIPYARLMVTYPITITTNPTTSGSIVVFQLNSDIYYTPM